MLETVTSITWALPPLLLHLLPLRLLSQLLPPLLLPQCPPMTCSLPPLLLLPSLLNLLLLPHL